MKKVIVIATALMVSSTAFAATQTVNTGKEIKSQGFATQEQAYDAGYTIMDDLNQMTANELKGEFNVFDRKLVQNSVQVKDMEVVVEEFAKSRNDIQYRAVVDVNYSYQHGEYN